jgi:hypothetical protein
VFTALLFSVLYSQQNHEWLWVNHAGGASYDYGTALVCDAEGNSFVTGQFVGTAAFGDFVIESNGDFDVFVAKVDSEGNYIWVSGGGGPSWEYINGISLDSAGNCYVTGYYASSAQFGSTTLSCNGYDDIFVAKLDSLGSWQWVASAGGIDRDAAWGVSCDYAGNVYVAGSFIGEVAFGDSVLTSAGQKDGYAAKLDSNGNWQWASRIGGTYDDYVYGITTDYLGNCYITGAFKTNGSAGSINLVCRGQEDIFIAKLSPSGSFVWAKSAGGMNVDEGCAIAVDSTYCYVTGRFESSATFGTTVLQSAGDKDIFVCKLNLNGSFIWTKKAGGSGVDTGAGICADGTGKIYLVGSYQYSLYVGSTYIMSNGYSDILVTQMDADGNFIWALEAGGLEVDYGKAISIDADGNIFLTGSFFNSAEFGDFNIVGYNYYDVFIAKIALESVAVGDEYSPSYQVGSYLANAYPNPVSRGSVATIKANLPKGETGELSIFNLKGQLLEKHFVQSGNINISFPNKPLAAGVYLYKLQTPSGTEVKKLILLR